MNVEELDVFIEEIKIDELRKNEEQTTNEQQPKSTGAVRKTPGSIGSIATKDYMPNNLQKTVDLINKNYRVVVILRGLPGSGKSFIAKRLIEDTVKDHCNRHNFILSADDYFMTNKGVYMYDASRITTAHDYVMKRFNESTSTGLSPLIIDNTNLQYWQFYYYIQVAVKQGYQVEILETATPWAGKESKLSVLNQHSVPLATIKKLKQKFETGLTIDDLMRSLNLEQPKLQLRNLPPLAGSNHIMIKNEVSTPAKKYQHQKQVMQQQSPVVKQETPVTKQQQSVTQPNFMDFSWNQPPTEPVFSDTWEPKKEVQDIRKSHQNMKPQPQRQKNKPVALTNNLVPHQQGCPSENPAFAQIRELYPNINDRCLWDLFENCNGDADWTVNLLYDENKFENTDSGAELTCNCVNGTPYKETTREEVQKDIPRTPNRNKKTENVKQVNLDGWMATKRIIEESIQIAAPHYTDNMKKVRSWKGKPVPSEIELEEVPVIDTNESLSPVESLVEVTVSQELVQQLDDHFGTGILKNDSKSIPSKVFISKTVAHQLYLEILEAFYSKHEEDKLKAIKEDADLAKVLMEQEKCLKYPQMYGNENPENFKDIMDMEAALQMYGKEVKASWQTEEPDSMALTMSKEKLIKQFPGIDKDVLMEIFAGFNHNFDDTVATLQESLQHNTPVDNIEMSGKLKQRAQEKLTMLEEKTTDNMQSYADDNYGAEMADLEECRETVEFHRNSQKTCIQRSREAINEKKYELATYYSNVARIHKMKIDEYNLKSASLMANMHETCQTSPNVLDLHYLNITEAIGSLDGFLDKHINKIRVMKIPYKDLFVITGRGLHSINQIATIKNRAKSRIKERNLKASEINPGLLKVKVYPNSPLSDHS